MELGKMNRETELLDMVNVTVLDPINAGIGTINTEATPEESQFVAEKARDCLVSVDPNAPSQCIDGRCCKCTLANEKAEARASIAGGADVSAFAAITMVGDYFGPNDVRPPRERLVEVDAILRGGGIVPGAHSDEKAVASGYVDDNGKPKTGCGADDKFAEILKRLSDSSETIEKYTSALLGSEYASEGMVFADESTLQRRAEGWNPVDAIKLAGDASDGKDVEVLEGSHSEMLVVFNYAKDTTVDRDALAETTEGRTVFVVDMWYIDKVANALAEGRPDSDEMYSKLKHAMVAFQIATYLTLCDGTQRPALLTQEIDEFAS